MKYPKLFLFQRSENTAHAHTCSTDVVCTGSFAFTIVAEDIEGEALTYLLTEPNAAYFEVDKNTGNVSVVKELDAEVCCGGSRNASVVSRFILILCLNFSICF